MPKKKWSLKLKGWFNKVRNFASKVLAKASILVVIAAAGWLAFWSKSWRIETVRCVNDAVGDCPPEVVSALSVIGGRPFIFSGVSGELASIKDRFGYIDYLSAKMDGWSSLVVTLKTDNAAVAVTMGNKSVSQRWYLLSRSGAIISEAESSGTLPRLYLNEDDWRFENHRIVSPYGLQAVHFLVMVGDKFPGVEAKVTGLGDLDVTVGGYEFLVSLEKDPSVSAATLQLLMAEPTIQDNRPKVIDLRFQNITLSY